MNLFDVLDRFLLSLGEFISYNEIFLIFLGLFLVTMIVVIIATHSAYEVKLIKTIDMFNNYFVANPQITEDNLLQFNDMMKSSRVPKQLRKQWQQFVLYRDNVASKYMSFDICVSSPIKNSTYTRDIKLMNIIAYCLTFISALLGLYCATYRGADVVASLNQILLTPILILFLNYLVTIFLTVRHNSIVGDIYQNYQYFEMNMDKATETLPDYVDYEVLFDRNEIKHGIPILYAYLQKRAEEEKKELDRARLKNVEHEKFNFDESGVESSLVLERAMQEAENYIAERKKFMQDIEQINAQITQEELSFRETTKEYQRQMQVSKESFDNFKEQLQDVSSTIEANYLKKQQQQELDRQRNLERDYDTATDQHKKIMENFQAELTKLEGEIAKSRKTLEKGMMSEFDAYSLKVFRAVKASIAEKELQVQKKYKAEIKELEEKIVAKDEELSNVYKQNQALGGSAKPVKASPVAETKPSKQQEEQSAEEEISFDYLDEEESSVPAEQPNDAQPAEAVSEDENWIFNYLDEESSTDSKQTQEVVPDEETEQEEEEELEQEVEQKTSKGRGRPKKEVVSTQSKESKGRGRPKKEPTTNPKAEAPSKGRGRPKKETAPVEAKAPSKGRGRPKKEEVEVKAPSKGRGRPKKENLTDIDAYLKEIDAQIAEENQKIQQSTKALANTKISRRKRN